jgi:hypothetical protein
MNQPPHLPGLSLVGRFVWSPAGGDNWSDSAEADRRSGRCFGVLVQLMNNPFDFYATWI